MPRALHLLKPPVTDHALEVIRRRSREPDTTLTVVLLQGATAPPLPARVRLHRLVDGPTASGPDAIGYSDLLDLIFSAEQVIAW